MQKKLTISIAENVYNDLYAVIGKRKISKFIENLIKPHIVGDNLSLAYQEMAQDLLKIHQKHIVKSASKITMFYQKL